MAEIRRRTKNRRIAGGGLLIFGMPANDYPWLSCLWIILDYLADVKSASARLHSRVIRRISWEGERCSSVGETKLLQNPRIFPNSSVAAAACRRRRRRIFRWVELSFFKKDKFSNILGNDPPRTQSVGKNLTKTKIEQQWRFPHFNLLDN